VLTNVGMTTAKVTPYQIQLGVRIHSKVLTT
jgi:hypothetical protein